MTTNDLLKYVNDEYEKWGLAGWSFKINSNQRRLGVCKYGEKLIEMSKFHILNHKDADVLDTLRHEIAHAVSFIDTGKVQHHNVTWQAYAKRIGAKPERCAKGLSNPPYNFTAQCKNCKRTYGAYRIRRRYTYRCPLCPYGGELNYVNVKKDNVIVDPVKVSTEVKSGTLSKTSTQLVYRCPKCDKKVEIVKETPFGSTRILTLSCGHSATKENLKTESSFDWTKFEDGRKLFSFQEITVNNIIELANGRALLALDMGLGKTLCAIATTRRLFDQMKDILVVTKAGLVLQWFEEYFKSSGMAFSAVIIENSNQKPIPGFPIHIVSYDLLRRMDTSNWNFKTVILDECQAIKNPTSQRTKQVRQICANATYILGTSGTPFKNNVDEYFTILNILRPDKHNSYADFVRRHCKVVKRGNSYKIEGLRDPEAFLAYNKDFVFRFEREAVLPDLPKIFRQYRYVDLDENLEDAYDALNDQFQAFYYKKQAQQLTLQDYSDLLAFFTKMRHLAGLAKIDACCEYVEEFIENCDRKLTIFVHHKDVAEILLGRINQILFKKQLYASRLQAEQDIHERQDTINKFRDDIRNRILIASTLASGEGLNLQFCSDCILLERQWNPANEEQAEARFPRPGSIASVINAIYIVALSTIDEFFAELVEKKRQWVKQGLDGSDDVHWDESSIIRELAEVLASKGKKKWRIK